MAKYTPEELGLSYDPYNISVPSSNTNTTDTKLTGLAKAKEDKLKRLAGGNLDRSASVVTNDGYVEKLGNKILGLEPLNPAELQYTYGIAGNSQVPEGSEDSKRLYLFGTKDNNTPPEVNTPQNYTTPEEVANNPMYNGEDYNGMAKVGILRGDMPSAEYRYISNGNNEVLNRNDDRNYGWDSGTEGVDTQKKMMDLLVDDDTATAVEALTHSSFDNMKNRIVRQLQDGNYEYKSPEGIKIIDEKEKKRLFGGGASEYYSSVSDLFGDSRDFEVDKDKVDRVLNKARYIAGLKRIKSKYYKGNETPESLAKRYNQTLDNVYGGLGSISAKYEASNDLAAINPDDQGAPSYGKHQLSTKAGTMQAFLKSEEGKRLNNVMRGLKDPTTQEFQDRFKVVMNSKSGESLAEDQTKYIKKNNYDPVKKYAEKLGIDTNNEAIQEMLWSQSIQHGYKGNKEILNNALATVGSNPSTEDLIKAVYSQRDAYARSNIANPEDIAPDRYINEANDVLSLLSTNTSQGNVVKTIDPSNMSDEEYLAYAEDYYNKLNPDNGKEWSVDRAVNLIPGLGASLTSTGINVVDTTLEMGGRAVADAIRLFDEDNSVADYIDEIDLTTAEEARDFSANLLGYKQKYGKEGMQEISSMLKNIQGREIKPEDEDWVDNTFQKLQEVTKDIPVVNQVTEILNGINKVASVTDLDEASKLIGLALATPETAIESMGDIAVLILGKGKGFTKLNKAIDVEKAAIAKKVKSKTPVPEANKLKLNNMFKERTILDKSASLISNNLGVLTVSANYMNDAEDAFVEKYHRSKTPGELLSGMAVTTLFMSLDKYVAIKNLSGVKGVANQFKALEGSLPKNAIVKSAYNALGITTRLGVGGTKEFFQELGQETQQALLEYDLVDDNFNPIPLSEEDFDKVLNQGLTGGVAGFGGGVHMSAPKAIIDLVGGTFSSVASNRKSKVASSTSNVETSTEQPVESQEERRATYISTLEKVAPYADKDIEIERISDVLDNLDTLEEYRDAIDVNKNPERLKYADEKVNTVIDKVSTLIESNPGLKLERKVIAKLSSNEVLGSDPIINEDTEELVNYSAEEKEAITERIMHLTLGSERNSNNDNFKGKLKTFAVTNGVTEKDADAIIKSYASVKEEAFEGNRGVLKRKARLQSLVTSGNPDLGKLKKEFTEIINFRDTTVDSINKLKNGINLAEQKARELTAIDLRNNTVRTKDPKPQFITTEYLKSEKDKNGERVPFKIYIKHNLKPGKEGRWIAETDIPSKYIKEKELTNKALSDVINKVSNKAYELLGESYNSGKLIVPEPSLGAKEGITKSRKADNTYITNAQESLAEYDLPNAISKVIIGDDVKINDKTIIGKSGKWSDDSDYRKINENITNVKSKEGSYTSDDVVLVNSIGTYKPKKSKNKNFYTSIVYRESALKDEINAATEAGATIVLDREVVQELKNTNARAGIAKYLTKDKGYVPLGGSKSIFVKVDETKAKELEEAKKAKKDKSLAESKAKKEETADKKVLEDLVIRRMVHKEKGENKEAKALNKEINELRKTIKEKYFTKVDDAEKALDDYLARVIRSRINKSIEDKEKGVAATERTTETSDIDYLVDKTIKEHSNQDSKVNELISFWNEVIEDKSLTKNQIIKKVEKKAKELNIDIEPSSLITDIVNTTSNGVGKTFVVESLYEKMVTDENGRLKSAGTISRVSFSNKNVTESSIEAFVKENKNKKDAKGNKLNPITQRKLELSPSKFISVREATILNTIPTNNLPSLLKTLSNKFMGSAKKIFPAANMVEKAKGEKYKEEVRNAQENKTSDNYTLYDNPARAILFGQDKISPEMITSMAVGVMNVVKTDKRKLMKGYKNKEQIAVMFNVQPEEVTRDMMQFTKDIGAFRKTLATSIGKEIAKNLGFGKNKSADLGYTTYERFIADLGNMAIELGIDQNIFEVVEKNSNEMAKLYSSKGADTSNNKLFSDKATTSFINLVSKKENKKEVLSKNITDGLDSFEKVLELIPQLSTRESGPVIGGMRKEDIQRRLEEIRNDDIGIEIASESKKALKFMMKTEFALDLNSANEFLDIVKNNEEDVKAQLGYIEIDSDQYNMLSYDEKDIQEAINREIEDSLEILKTFVEKNKDSAIDNEIVMNFPFSFINNGRFHLDSNTINPQSDKLHRFLVQPKANKRTYRYDKNTGTFTSEGKKVSLLVRLAIAQSFGVGVDKKITPEIIKFGNDMLSLTEDELNKIKKDIIKKGESTIEINGVEREIEAEHLTHTLQGINFLMQLQKGDEVTSYLSAEFDSLTSGSANKVQQMPILGDLNAPIEDEKNNIMHEQLARVGVLTEHYIETQLKESLEGYDELGKTKAVNDVLGGAEGFLDSYKNLAKKTLLGIPEKVKEYLSSNNGGADKLNKQRAEVFEELVKNTNALPGTEVIRGALEGNPVDESTIAISSAMRNMFKNPFMIFNYSASIFTIKKNLGLNMASDLLKKVAKTDLDGTTEEDLDGKKLIEFIANNYKFIDNNVSKKLSLKEVQQKVREEPTFMYKTKINGRSSNLHSELAKILETVYGSTVEDVFRSEFGKYIEVQDLTNDAFKIMFRVFDSRRMELLKKTLSKKGYYSTEDIKNIQDELWSDFPYIMGPLSERKEGFKDIIPVAGKRIGSPSTITEAGKSAQTRIKNSNGKGYKQVVIHPLVTELDEAVSAGSVLPYHFIDGAEMSTMVNKFYDRVKNKAGIIGIHDAFITALTEVDDSLRDYVKAMKDINSEYSIVKEINDMLERVEITEDERKNISSKGLKFTKEAEKDAKKAKKEVKISFGEAFDNIKTAVADKNTEVTAYRTKWKDTLAKAYNGNMVGTPIGMVKDGQTITDYESEFENQGVYTPVKRTKTTTKVDNTNNKFKFINNVNSTVNYNVNYKLTQTKKDC